MAGGGKIGGTSNHFQERKKKMKNIIYYVFAIGHLPILISILFG